MKLNINKLCYLTLHSVSIALAIFLSALLLLTDYTVLSYISLIVTYLLGIYLVKQIHRYPLWIQK